MDPENPPRWRLHRQPDGYLLIDAASFVYVRLEALAAELYMQLASGRTLEELARIRAVQDNLPLTEAEDLLKQILLGDPLTEAWIDPGRRESLVITGSDRFYCPLSVSLQLTNGCNLACPFCYAASGVVRDNELSANEWIRLIERLAAMGCLTLALTGGEPTMAKGFKEILIAASAYLENVVLFTNGYVLPARIIQLIADLGNVSVQISVDGMEETHNRIRGGRNAFRKTIYNISQLVGRNVEVSVSLAATSDAVPQIEELGMLLDSLGVANFRVGDVQPLGRATSGGNGFELSSDRSLDVARSMDRLAESVSNMRVFRWSGCSNTTELITEQTDFKGEFSTPGALSWHILSDGSVTPCQLEEAAILGNIREDGIETIAARSSIVKACSSAIGCTCAKYVKLAESDDIAFQVSMP